MFQAYKGFLEKTLHTFLNPTGVTLVDYLISVVHGFLLLFIIIGTSALFLGVVLLPLKVFDLIVARRRPIMEAKIEALEKEYNKYSDEYANYRKMDEIKQSLEKLKIWEPLLYYKCLFIVVLLYIPILVPALLILHDWLGIGIVIFIICIYFYVMIHIDVTRNYFRRILNYLNRC